MEIKDVYFQNITEQTFNKLDLSNLQFFMVSQSGVIDVLGNIYLFMIDGAFVIEKCDNNFTEKLLSTFSKWEKINLYFCDFLIINPKISDSFIPELYARNIRDFWFETAVEIYRDKYCE